MASDEACEEREKPVSTVHGVALVFEGGGMRNSYSAGAGVRLAGKQAVLR